MAVLAVIFFYFTNNTAKYGQKLVSTVTTGAGIAFSILYALQPLLTSGTPPNAQTLLTSAAIAGIGWVTNNTADMGPLTALIQKLGLKNPSA